MLVAVRGALSERRSIVEDVLNFSALTGAVGDDRRPPDNERRGGVSSCPSKSRTCGKECYSPQTGEAPLPLPRGLGGTSTAPVGASAVPADTSADNPVAGGTAPSSGIDSTAVPSARGDGGVGSHLSEVVRSPSLPSSSSDDEFANAGGGESPCCSRSRYSSLYCSRCSRRLILLLREGRSLRLLLPRSAASSLSSIRRRV
jgi:hypothetical protein